LFHVILKGLLITANRLPVLSQISCPSNPDKELTMKKLFVGNLSFGATEDTIRSLFENHGTVESVSLITDRDTGRSKGFGFVEMTNDAEAARAIAAVNGKEIDGRALTVNEARPKTDRPGGGGGGRNRW
jgi:cold-inducible RNA-binding protein